MRSLQEAEGARMSQRDMPPALLREVIVPRDCMWLPDDDATLAGPGTEGPLFRACPALSLAFGPPPQANGLSSACMAGTALLSMRLFRLSIMQLRLMCACITSGTQEYHCPGHKIPRKAHLFAGIMDSTASSAQS